MKWLYRIHGWAGLLIGLPMLVATLSGAAAVFKPEIDAITDDRLGPAPTVAPEVPALDDALAAVAEAFPGAHVRVVATPARPGSQLSHGPRIAMQVDTGDRLLGVFCHPVTGEVIGHRPLGDGWGQWLRDLHIRLFAGHVGRVVVGVIGLATLASTVTGLLIYRRFNGNRWRPRIARGRRRARARWGEAHRVGGLVAALAGVLFGFTGAVLGLEVLIEPVHDGSLPAPPHPGAAGPAPPGDWMDQPFESAYAIAEGAMPAAHVVALAPPHPGQASIRVYLDHPAMDLVREFSSLVDVDPVDGEVLQVHDARRLHAGWRAFLAMEPLHFGRLGGSLTVKVIFATAAVLLSLLPVSGYAVWWLRKRKAKRAASP